MKWCGVWDDALLSILVAEAQLCHKNPCIYKKTAFQKLSIIMTNMHKRLKVQQFLLSIFFYQIMYFNYILIWKPTCWIFHKLNWTCTCSSQVYLQCISWKSSKKNMDSVDVCHLSRPSRRLIVCSEPEVEDQLTPLCDVCL